MARDFGDCGKKRLEGILRKGRVSQPKDVLSLMVFLETQLLMAGILWESIQQMTEVEIVERAAAIQLIEEHQAEQQAAMMGG